MPRLPKHLDPLSHDDPAEGVCVMEAVSLYADEPFSACPECACPHIASVAMVLNDWVDDDERRRLIPYIPALAGSRDGEGASDRLEAIREWAQMWLSLVSPRSRARLPETYAVARDKIVTRPRETWEGEVAMDVMGGVLMLADYDMVCYTDVLDAAFALLDRFLAEPSVDAVDGAAPVVGAAVDRDLALAG